MNFRILVIFLLLCSLIAAGCVNEDETGADENISDGNGSDVSENDNMTDGSDNESQVTDDETPVDEDEMLSDEVPEDDGNEEDDSGVSVVESTDPRRYTVTLKNFLAQPSSLNISEGDSIFWINMNQPTRTFTLISDEGLWEDKPLTYRSSFIYTFNETGTYNYHVLGFEERMKGTITVE